MSTVTPLNPVLVEQELAQQGIDLPWEVFERNFPALRETGAQYAEAVLSDMSGMSLSEHTAERALQTLHHTMGMPAPATKYNPAARMLVRFVKSHCRFEEVSDIKDCLQAMSMALGKYNHRFTGEDIYAVSIIALLTLGDSDLSAEYAG